MARIGWRQQTGASLVFILGGAAVLLLCVAVGFGIYVYFFAPWEDEPQGPALGPGQRVSTPAGSPTQPVRLVAVATNTPAPSPPVQATRPPGASPTPPTAPGSPPAGATPPRSPTPPGGSGTPQPTAPPAITPRPETTVTAAATPPSQAWPVAFRSSLFSYSLNYPSTWAVRAGGLKVGDRTVDAFVGPRIGNFTPNVTVFAQNVAMNVDSDAFLRSNIADLNAAGVQVQARPEAVPAGMRAQMMSYPVSSGDLRYDVTQVLFALQGKGWVVTLSAPSGETNALLPVLRGMLGSFRIEQ